VRLRFLLFTLASAGWAQQAFIPSVIATPGAPSRSLFGTYKGAFLRSADGGSTWTPIYLTTPGLPQPAIQGIVLDALNSSTVYVATSAEVGGIWKSADNGATWATASSGLPSTGGPVLDLKQLANTPPSLIVRVGTLIFKSDDGGASWVGQGSTPGPSGALGISDAPLNEMFFVDANTLDVSKSVDYGHSWMLQGTIPTTPAPGQMVVHASVIGNTTDKFFVSLVSAGVGSGTYLSLSDGGFFMDQSGAGLGLFTKMDWAPGQSVFAFGDGGQGFYRSDDFGQTWRGFGVSGGTTFALGTVDPNTRTTIYADRGGSFPGLVKSLDSGINWTAIPATIMPTLAKPVTGITAMVEETAPFSQSFTVAALEDSTWPLAVTITTSGEPWLAVGAASGTTPLANSLTINTTGMPPGTYQSKINIAAPQSFNGSVTIPVTLTIVPAGTGSLYSVRPFGGNGQATGFVTSGSATTVAIGAAKALTFDNSGKLLVSAGNRIWSFSGGQVNPIAGSGAFGSNGDGTDALSAQIADPDGLLVDPQGIVYFTEFSTGRVRKILNGAISTVVDLSKSNMTGSHALLMDTFGRLILVNPTGLLRFDGIKLTTMTPYAMVDPYSMVMDTAGNIYVSDRGTHQILKFAGGAVTVVAGSGSAAFGGDGGPANRALLNKPSGLAIDGNGTLYVADSGNQRVRTITMDGMIHTIAGSGMRGFAGDGSAADFASFMDPAAVAVDAKGSVYVADTGNNRVRALVATVTPAARPTAVVHAASGSLQIAPGGLFSVYGDALSLIAAQTQSAAWPTTLGGVTVTINGVPAPLYYASQKLINGQVPYEVAPGPATVMVTVTGAQPAQIGAQVVAANPGLLLYNGRALAVNPDGSVNTPSAPAPAGNFVILYLSGIGIPDHPVATGAAAPSMEPFARVAYPNSITVGGQSAQILYFGLAPGYPALAQANIIVPTLPTGDYPVTVTVNGQSNTANISVRGN
jgi:uncharacterized protein (TIGR03437 family)